MIRQDGGAYVLALAEVPKRLRVRQETQRVLIPLNVNNSHWTLIECDTIRGEIIYWDSMGGSIPADALKAARTYLASTLGFLQGAFTSRRGNGPQQDNGRDCGVFVCRTALARAAGGTLSFTAADMSAIRRQMVLELITSGRLLGQSLGEHVQPPTIMTTGAGAQHSWSVLGTSLASAEDHDIGCTLVHLNTVCHQLLRPLSALDAEHRDVRNRFLGRAIDALMPWFMALERSLTDVANMKLRSTLFNLPAFAPLRTMIHGELIHVEYLDSRQCEHLRRLVALLAQGWPSVHGGYSPWDPEEGPLLPIPRDTYEDDPPEMKQWLRSLRDAPPAREPDMALKDAIASLFGAVRKRDFAIVTNALHGLVSALGDSAESWQSMQFAIHRFNTHVDNVIDELDKMTMGVGSAAIRWVVDTLECIETLKAGLAPLYAINDAMAANVMAFFQSTFGTTCIRLADAIVKAAKVHNEPFDREWQRRAREILASASQTEEIFARLADMVDPPATAQRRARDDDDDTPKPPGKRPRLHRCFVCSDSLEGKEGLAFVPLHEPPTRAIFACTEHCDHVRQMLRTDPSLLDC